MPSHENGWHFTHGPATYMHREPHMTVAEYHSYRDMWIAVYGNHESCEHHPCSLRPLQPPPEKPRAV